MHWYFAVLKKYAVFQGRAGRKEFWYFSLFNAVALMLLTLVDLRTGTYQPQIRFGLLSGIYFCVVFLPALGVSVRRMHDIGKSGWWVLASGIPFIGWIIWIALAVRVSDQGTNAFGPSPQASEPPTTSGPTQT